MSVPQCILNDCINEIENALGEVLKEYGVRDEGLQSKLTQVIAAGVKASPWQPLETFAAYYNDTEAVQNAIFRINAFVSYVKD